MGAKSYGECKIAFVYQVKGNDRQMRISDICVVNHDGTGFANLTNGAIQGTCPRWTPDRKQIVFLVRSPSNRGPKWDSYQINADGTDLKKIDHFYVWAREGRRRAFVATDSGNQDVYSISAGESTPRRLTDHPKKDYSPAWSTDGTKIAFVSDRNGPGDIYAVNADGTDQKRLTGGGWGFGERYDDCPMWCANDSRVVYVSNHSIRTVDLDGKRRTLVKEAGIFSVSPDGRQIAYLKIAGRRRSLYPDFSPDLNVMDVDGANGRRLTGDVAQGALTMRGHWRQNVYDLAWSPDGKKIVFPRAGALYTINADGTEEKQLNIEGSPTGTLVNPTW
jgi:TolB protein